MRNLLPLTFTLISLSLTACTEKVETVFLPYFDTVEDTAGSAGDTGGTAGDTAATSDAVTCTDQCTDGGAKRCNGQGVPETCTDTNGDGCLEWGNAAPCATGQACQDGQCAVGCTDECAVQGERRCDGNSVETCRDHDSNGCLEWGGAQECLSGTVCQSGFCSVGCDGEAECTVKGARRCAEGGVETCADPEFDGCLGWTDAEACPNGQTCSNGSCGTSCSDECSVVGARKCNGTGGYATCGESDGNGCLDWNTTKTCAEGEICSNGFCAKECASECSVIGAARCSGDAVETCGDVNGDGCLEWGTALPCDTGLVCSNGYCSVSCSDECSVSGARVCDVGGVKECGDADDDGCLEWGTVVPCDASQSCSNGQCATGCQDECSVNGARKCLGSAVQVCGNADADECLEWGTATPCGQDEVCSNGFCATDCTEECTVSGAAICEGDAIKTCGVGEKGCLVYGAPVACAAGLTCSSGKCASTCTDECTVVGAKKCIGTGVSTCGNTDSDSCLEWGTASSCSAGQACSNGFCTTSCSDECSVNGAKICEGQGVKLCSDTDQDGCLEWGSPVTCEAGTTCSNGLCSSTCSDECGPAGSKRCDTGGVQSCGNTDTDGCLEWGSAVACGAGQACSGGACTLTCKDDCNVKGERRCASATTFETCDDQNDDGCLEWGTAEACTGGDVCALGSCALSCVNECDTSGAKRCNVAGTGVELCAEHDGDGCLEWGTSVPCPGGQACDVGSCTVTCQNTCAAVGLTQCSGNGVQTCGDGNGDGCLEWSGAVACGVTATCASGACAPKAPPGTAIISEVLYDDASDDTTGFVELKGPPGLDLTGFSLVGVNGANGADYGVIALDGSFGQDGFFVVATPTSSAGVLAVADQLSANADYQNGPDSVQLRWGTTVVDAVGYGSFTSAIFGGEGQAAVDVAAGSSLGRNAVGADTNDNKVDFFAFAAPTAGAANGATNTAPTAKLTCPSTAKTGQQVTVDATGSADTDGTITQYQFAWGDGYSASGPTVSASHAYATPGPHTVTLTVTDDAGGTATASCPIAISDANAPTVVVVSPGADLQVTQGTVVAGITIDVTPAPGRSITAVQLVVDGVPTGTIDSQAPYTFSYTVPAAAATGGTLLLQAQATDNQSTIGTSAARKLLVRNDKPVASLSAVITGNLQVGVDASGSTDTETAGAALEVRFDWENDGVWDTVFSTTKTLSHTYLTDGEKTIKMEVKDAVGQTTTATRSVNFQNVQDISGTVTTTLWYGTINVTGDITVPAGETLSIAPGTTVVFLEFDQDNNGVGDFDLTVNGTLKVLGTAEAPVIITVLDTDAKADVSAWGTIRLNGSNNTIENAIIEWGDVGLDLRGTTTLTNVELRRHKTALSISSTVTGTNVNLHDNTGDGLVGANGTFTLTNLTSVDNGGRGVFATTGGVSQITNCLVSDNVSHGFDLDAAKVSATDCAIENNGGVGVYHRGASTGLITRSTIRGNGYEGVRAHWNASGNPTAQVRLCNILENASKGSLKAQAVNFTASSSNGDYGTVGSATFTAPAGARILLIESSHTNSAGSSNITGTILGSGGTTLRSMTSTVSRSFTPLDSSVVTSAYAQVTDLTSSYGGSTTLHTVVHTGGPAGIQVASYLVNPGVAAFDARRNFLGAWPNVLNVVAFSTPSSLLIGGFVGEAFDTSFVPGNYLGEIDITSATVWDQDVYVTGDVSIKSTGSLTINAGVQVTFVPTDQDADGIGDWTLVRTGNLTANGALGSPVVMTSLTHASITPPASGGFRAVDGTGTGTTSMTFVNISDSEIAINAAAGATTLSDVTITGAKRDAFTMSGAGTLALTRVTVTDPIGDGVDCTSGTGAFTMTASTVTGSDAYGVRMQSCSSASNLIDDSNLTYNTLGGVSVTGGALAVTQSNLKFNGWGIIALGAASGSVTASNLQSNTREGIFVGMAGGSNPTLSFTGNNIFGNTQIQSVKLAVTPVSASSTNGDYGTTTSTTLNAPSGGRILYTAGGHTNTSGSSNITGAIIGDGISKSFSQTTATAWYDWALPGVSSVYAQVVDLTSSYGGSTSITQVVQSAPGTPAAEMAALRTTSGKIIATGNYWGVTVPTSTQVTELTSATIDYTAFKTTQIGNTGPQ
ncbi:MAG: right-handed parallel beta-helix repeat-containing protein [Myxococcales bacterium]|nr:right-handed parallel beta-helix repeat-containing protein [Myxococcales bacterium]